MQGGKPMINVISEKRHLTESDGKVDNWYQNEAGASGIRVDIDGYIDSNRRSVSRAAASYFTRFSRDEPYTSCLFEEKSIDLLQIV